LGLANLTWSRPGRRDRLKRNNDCARASRCCDRNRVPYDRTGVDKKYDDSDRDRWSSRDNMITQTVVLITTRRSYSFTEKKGTMKSSKTVRAATRNERVAMILMIKLSFKAAAVMRTYACTTFCCAVQRLRWRLWRLWREKSIDFYERARAPDTVAVDVWPTSA
jgi:hypothetical protein